MTQTSTVIRIGDKFKTGNTIYEVIGTKPGGKVELFNRAECLFTDRWHREVMHWGKGGCMTPSPEDYIYVLEDATGNTSQINPQDGIKLLQEGTAFKLKIYRLWRVYEEKKQ